MLGGVLASPCAQRREVIVRAAVRREHEPEHTRGGHPSPLPYSFLLGSTALGPDQSIHEYGTSRTSMWIMLVVG